MRTPHRVWNDKASTLAKVRHPDLAHPGVRNDEPGPGRAQGLITPARYHCWLAGTIAYFRGMALPRVQPIRPTWRKQPFDAPDWLFDVKYDGFRGLCYVEQGRGRFISRNGNTLSRFDALGAQLAAVFDVDEAVIDGEVIAADETGRPQFYELLRRTRSPCYVAFDLVWLNGADLRPLPLSERRRHLQRIVPKGSSVVTEVLSVHGRGCELFELMREHDLEGIVAKRLADPYDARVRWLKIKNPDYSQKEGRGDLLNRHRR
jgi:ATP-dependent DNA ligase